MKLRVVLDAKKHNSDHIETISYVVDESGYETSKARALENAGRDGYTELAVFRKFVEVD